LFSLDSSNSQQFVISVSTGKSGIYSCIVLQVVVTAIKNLYQYANERGMSYIFKSAFQ
jgi:hypothetical protein